ncbi:MAG: hypothetical protein JWQ21_2120 [Herminiimonas sp.]|nr:hypothetical protein [Herminiimonas sp.]
MNIHSGNVGSIINLAIAPAFLLVGMGTQFRVLANRLGRIIDRCRVLELRIDAAAESARAERRDEVDILYRRMRLIHRAMILIAASALLICVVIIVLFFDTVFDLDVDKLIALLFVVSMLSMIGSFILFLREIFLVTAAMSASVRRSLMSGKSG